MHTIKNTAQGPRGLHTADGDLVYLDAGETRELDVSDAELASAKSTGHFEIGGKAKAQAAEHAAEPKAKA